MDIQIIECASIIVILCKWPSEVGFLVSELTFVAYWFPDDIV